MPLYKRTGSPFWQYSFALHGSRFRGSTGCTGKREAALVEAERYQDAKRSALPRQDWTLHHCLGVYWSERAKHLASGKVVLAILDHLRQHIGRDTPVMALTNARLMDYRASRRGAAEKAGRPIQANTVNRDFACLKAALNHANQMHGQQIPALAWSRIVVKEPPHRRRFASGDEYQALLAECDSDLRAVVRFAVATGLRKGNILALDWQQVDLHSSLVTVKVKGGKLHTVKLTSEWRAALSTVKPEARKGAVFNRTNFRRRWQGAIKHAGIEDFRFHDLRHTFASWARLNGADLADICEALGHSSVSVTMRYAHIEPTTHKTAFDRVSASVWSQFKAQSAKDGTND